MENGIPPSGDSTLVGSVKKFACEDCFELRGLQTLTCQENGKWNGSLPTCNSESMQSTEYTDI